MYPAHAQTLPTASVPEPLMFTAAYFQDMSWRNIGPFQGGRANSAAGVRGDNLTYFMGTVGGGIWKTTDAGLSWFNISDGFFSSASIGEIAISHSDPNVIYAGSGEHAVRGVMSNYGDGVYKTTDEGQTWSHIGLAGTRHISGIAIHPNNPDYILVAAQGAVFGPSTERGIYLSEDGGKTWEKTLYINETTGASDIVINPANPRIIYATLWDHARTPWSIRSGGPGSGIFKSIDGGKNWTKLTSGLPEEVGKVGISISPVNPLVLYAIVEAEQGGVYRSRDGGRNWIATCTDRVTWARSWYYMEIEADPVDEQTVYVLNAPLLKSIDGGRTFDYIETPQTDHHDLRINT
ncbi:MAG: glycosyl hydrolase, partial [Saprospiraceae bacterium]|nr:glycosyl hydrolase [Saprospiraceae bacterium]